MWVTKLKLPSDSSHLIASRTKKHNISLWGYPISHHKKTNEVIVTISGILLGKEKNKKAFIKDVKKDKRTLFCEVNKDFLIAKISQPEEVSVVYNENIIPAKPFIVTEAGEYIWELASWEKAPLLPIIKLAKAYNGQLLWIKKKKLSNIGIALLHPELSPKQKYAIELATKRGYYDQPRKVTLKQLAKEANSAYSTFQYHLQTAEKKLLPAMVKRIKEK